MRLCFLRQQQRHKEKKQRRWWFVRQQGEMIAECNGGAGRADSAGKRATGRSRPAPPSSIFEQHSTSMSWDEPQKRKKGGDRTERGREEIEPRERGRGFRSVAAGGIETERGCGGGSCRLRWKRTVVAVGSSLVKVPIHMLFPVE
ncbi:hypothetical protein LXL04_007432 [Taraxacum kok-saghyz]